MNKKRYIRILSVVILFVTLLTFGFSYYTDYKVQQVKAEGGVSLKLSGDEGIAHTSQAGYKVIKGGIGWYKNGTEARVSATVRNGYTFTGWFDGTQNVSSNRDYNFNIRKATELVAKTSINKYKITVELAGGTINGSTSWSTTYTIKDSVALPTPVKTGYTFLGWVEKGTNGTPNKNVVIPVGSTGDKTYVAKWEIKTFEVDVNGILDGGAVQENTRDMGTFETYVNGVLATRNNYYDYCDRAVPYGTEIEIKNIRAETGRTYVKSSKSLKFTVTGNVYMTLQFKTNEYTYRFNANGGTGSMSDIKAKHGISVKIPASTFKKDYNTQTDWNTVAGGTDTKYALGGTISGYSGKDGDVVTLYAQWRKNKVSISYHANGGKMGSGSGADYKIGTDGDILKGSSKLMNTGIYGELITGEDTVNDLYNVYAVGYVTLVKTGYHTVTTSDWNTQTNGSGKSYDSMLAYKATDFADLKDSDKSVTLYANWKPNNYKVRYNGNGATSGTMTDSSHVYDTSKVLTRNAYARTGYTFTGWNTKSDGKGTAYADGASVKNLTANKDVVVTLYAQWKANSYILTYDANGGTVSTSSKTLQYGDAFGILPTPKRDGHKFLGWYTSATGGTNVSETTKIDAKNTTIYAHWDAYTLSINYHGDGAEYLHDFDFDENKELGLVNVTGKDIVKVQTVRYGSKLSDNGVLDGGRFKKTGYTAENLVMLLKGGTSISTQVPYTAVDLATKAGKQDAFKTGNVSIDIYPKWTVNTYTNEIIHWAGGFQNQEGNNKDKNCLFLNTTTFSSSYNSKYVLDSSKKVTIPNGYSLRQTFGSNDVSYDGSWQKHPFGTQVTQKPRQMEFEYVYNPNTYKITYNLNGGTNNSANPTSYTVLYGVTLKNPTRTGYTFDGWESNMFNLAQQKFTCINNVSGNELHNAKMQVWKDGKFLVQTLELTSVGDASKKYIHNYDTGMYTIRLAANGTLQDMGNYYAENVYLEKSKTYTFSFRVEEASKSKYVISNVKVNKDGGTKVTGINEGKKANFATSAELYSELAKRTIGDVALEARWTAKTLTYNVQYVSSSGKTLGSSTVSGTFGTTKDIEAPAKTGYVTPSKQSVVFDSETAKTIKFVYTPTTYNITLKNATTNGTDKKIPYTIETLTFSLESPSKTGYTFTGWTGSNGSTPQKTVTISQGSTGDRVYTANWKSASVLLETGSYFKEDLLKILGYTSVRSIQFVNTGGESMNGYYTTDVSANKDGSIEMCARYDGGSMSWMNIFIYSTVPDMKIQLNPDSNNMWSYLYNNSLVTVDFGYGIVDDSLVGTMEYPSGSNLKFTGDDICGLVTHVNNQSLNITENSEDSSILDVIDTLTPQLDDITKDSEDTSDTVVEQSDEMNNDLDGKVDESQPTSGSVEGVLRNEN